MKIGVRYETIYRYDRAVRFSPHDVRLFPRTDRFVRMTRLDFRTQPETTVRFGRDVFDNVVASCFFDQPAEMLELRLAIDVEAAKKNPFDFVLSRRAVQMPFQLRGRYRLDHLRLLQTSNGDKSISLPGWTPPSQESPRETVATLVELTNALHQTISYERREEGAAQSPAETLRRQRGACRDTAVLLAEMLRELGLAARVVSGYLAGGEGFVARKVRYMRGRKFFCLAPAGLDWTRPMASSAMIISFRRRLDYAGGHHPDQRKFLSSGSRPGGNEEPARADHAVR